MMDQRVRHILVGADFDKLYLLRLDIVLADQALHFRHSRMGERPRRERLDRHPGIGKSPGMAQLVHDRGWIVASARSLEEPARSFENLMRGSPAESCEFGRD